MFKLTRLKCSPLTWEGFVNLVQLITQLPEGWRAGPNWEEINTLLLNVAWVLIVWRTALTVSLFHYVCCLQIVSELFSVMARSKLVRLLSKSSPVPLHAMKVLSLTMFFTINYFFLSILLFGVPRLKAGYTNVSLNNSLSTLVYFILGD